MHLHPRSYIQYSIYRSYYRSSTRLLQPRRRKHSVRSQAVRDASITHVSLCSKVVDARMPIACGVGSGPWPSLAGGRPLLVTTDFEYRLAAHDLFRVLHTYSK